MDVKPNPGSRAASELGCTCPVMDNAYGHGIPGSEEAENGPHFYISAGCPVHGSSRKDESDAHDVQS